VRICWRLAGPQSIVHVADTKIRHEPRCEPVEVVQHIDHRAVLLLTTVASCGAPKEARSTIEGVVPVVALDFSAQTVAEAPAHAHHTGKPDFGLQVRRPHSKYRVGVDLDVRHDVHAGTGADIKAGDRLRTRRDGRGQHGGCQECTAKLHLLSPRSAGASGACGYR